MREVSNDFTFGVKQIFNGPQKNLSHDKDRHKNDLSKFFCLFFRGKEQKKVFHPVGDQGGRFFSAIRWGLIGFSS